MKSANCIGQPSLATTTALQSTFSNHFLAEITLNNITTQALVNTGSTNSYVSKEFVKKHNLPYKTVNYRGGVEDTRLEAKAKDTKKSEAKDSLSEDRRSRGQGQECEQGHKRKCSPKKKKKKKGLHKNFSGDLPKKKKKSSSQKFFKRSPQKNAFQKIFQALHKILIIQKILLSSSRRQANFRGLEASRPTT